MLLVDAIDAADATREDSATALKTLDAKTMLAVCSGGPGTRLTDLVQQTPPGARRSRPSGPGPRQAQRSRPSGPGPAVPTQRSRPSGAGKAVPAKRYRPGARRSRPGAWRSQPGGPGPAVPGVPISRILSLFSFHFSPWDQGCRQCCNRVAIKNRKYSFKMLQNLQKKITT